MNKPKPRRVVLISGSIASGKTTLSHLLADGFGFCVFSTRGLLAEAEADRLTLQAAGASLDDSTAGRWVLDGLLRLQEQFPNSTLFAVDAVRTPDQIRWVRNALREPVVHVHLTATEETLSRRYAVRGEQSSYAEVSNHQVESGVRSLGIPS